jgi:transposase
MCARYQRRRAREVNDFGATTAELIRMAQWLKERGVKSVAMESTGVHWIAPHEILEAQGFEVLLADTRQLSRVPGRVCRCRMPSSSVSPILIARFCVC